MTITELREKRAKTWSAMENFLDSHRNDQGVLSEEDDAIYWRISYREGHAKHRLEQPVVFNR